MARLDTLARRVLDARDDYNKKKKSADAAEEKKKEAEAAMYDELVATKQKTATLELGGKYGTWRIGKRVTVRSRVIDRDVLKKALEDLGMGDGYTYTEVRKAAMNELVREYRDQGKPLPDGLDYSETRYVQATAVED